MDRIVVYAGEGALEMEFPNGLDLDDGLALLNGALAVENGSFLRLVESAGEGALALQAALARINSLRGRAFSGHRQPHVLETEKADTTSTQRLVASAAGEIVAALGEISDSSGEGRAATAAACEHIWNRGQGAPTCGEICVRCGDTRTDHAAEEIHGAHLALVHPDGAPCPDGCDTPADPEALERYRGGGAIARVPNPSEVRRVIVAAEAAVEADHEYTQARALNRLGDVLKAVRGEDGKSVRHCRACDGTGGYTGAECVPCHGTGLAPSSVQPSA